MLVKHQTLKKVHEPSQKAKSSASCTICHNLGNTFSLLDINFLSLYFPRTAINNFFLTENMPHSVSRRSVLMKTQRKQQCLVQMHCMSRIQALCFTKRRKNLSRRLIFHWALNQPTAFAMPFFFLGPNSSWCNSFKVVGLPYSLFYKEHNASLFL